MIEFILSIIKNLNMSEYLSQRPIEKPHDEQNEIQREEQRSPEMGIEESGFQKSLWEMEKSNLVTSVNSLFSKVNLLRGNLLWLSQENKEYNSKMIHEQLFWLSIEICDSLKKIDKNSFANQEEKNKITDLIHSAEVLDEYLSDYSEKRDTNPDNPENQKDFNEMQNKLSTIKNKDFLKEFGKNDRLGKITKPSIEAKDVKSWEDIKFTFTFENKLNENLYLKTTVGQVLPSEVREVKDQIWNIYTRNWLDWEFFDKWNRLIIHDWTIITPTKILTEEQIKIEEENNRKRLADSWNKEGTENFDIARMANDRWLDIQTAINLFWWMFKWIVTWKEQQDARNVEIEELLTELERSKWYFKDDYPSIDFEKDWKLTPEFLSYYLNQTHWDKEKRKEYVKTLWIDEHVLEKYSRKNIEKKYSWYKELSDEEKFEISKIDPKKLESFEKPSFWMRFEPWSKEAQELFTYAAMKAGLPKEWWNNKWLHYILKNESRWIVWVPNYKMVERHITWEDLKKVNSNISWENVAWTVWVSSTATWLWQLTLSNEKYLPNWRNSIWVPLDEAIWMLRYIDDRYGNADIAYNMYWKIWNYTHPDKWPQVKQFREWY